MSGTSARRLALAAALGALALPAAQAAGSRAPTATPAPRLTASAAAVAPGASLRLLGRGFPADAHLTLLVGGPRGRTSRMGSAVTGRRGDFVATIRVRAHAAAGTFRAVACQDACRVQASVRFRILRG